MKDQGATDLEIEMTDEPRGGEPTPVPTDEADAADGRDGRDGLDGPDGRPEVEAALQELQDRHLRLAAEFENFRKRTREELAQSAERAQGRLVASLLEAVDDFERIHTLDPSTVTVASVLEGVALVQRKLLHVLQDAGLTMLNPEAGEAFDPKSMEALLRVPTDDPEHDDRVDQVLQKGAQFHQILLRPARVSVRKLED
jgi:molecular chaperone GrpE